MTGNTLMQQRLTDATFTGANTDKNIEAVGDTLQLKGSNILRIAFQNIHGVSDLRGHAVPSELEAMEELHIDVMGMAETNKPWTPRQRAIYDAYMQNIFHTSRTLYTAAKTADHTTNYQPGGNLLTVNGSVTSRIDGRGTDKWGRFGWYTFQGKRDEGVLVIVAYRVCQTGGTNTGPLTAYRQQYVALRGEGIINPNPRAQILNDLHALITEKRAQGYRPILLIDANGDYTTGRDTGLANFVSKTQLCDPFHDRFGHTRTYLHGKSRLDYIFMDAALVHSISHIGYLGTHDGAVSDHVMAYVDMDHTKLFSGLIHRPPTYTAREILIEQEDKVQEFLRSVWPLLESHNIATRVFKLADSFAQHKATNTNITAYTTLYGQFLELVKGAAKQIGRQKHGYQRSTTLTLAGNQVLLMRYAYDCKRRGAPPTKKLVRLGERLKIDVQTLLEGSELGLRRKLREARQVLWEAQKSCESNRLDWLATEAKSRALAAGDMDHTRRLEIMQRKIAAAAVNRKLTAITKGTRGALQRIQVPLHDWFYSPSNREVYRYHRGVFDAYPAASESLFFSHHTRKVLPNDVQAVTVEKDDTDKFWRISGILPMPTPLWKDITAAEDIEAELLQRNQMHLEQTDREQGISTGPTLTALQQNYGYNELSRKILDGAHIEEYELTTEMTALFRALERTEQERELRPILGSITSTEFQQMFKIARERTSSDSRTLNYTLWKCLARSDKISGFACVLLSLPFVYGFPNPHWTHMTDFMLEKKPGVRQIHTLRIIGKVAAEFNTCLKFLIGKQARDNFESSDPCEEQHGFRPNRSAPDAMMLKLLTYESARMQKCTIGSLQHDMTAHFDRMYPEMTSIYATKYAVSENIMTSIGATIARLRRNVETAVGVSKGTYGNTAGEFHIGGMVQGKADVPQFSTQQCDAMLKAHKSLTYGVEIISPGIHRSIRHHSVAFADDTDGQVSSDTTETTSLPRLVRRLQHSGQTWNNLTNICGGLIAHHKCMWQLLAWEETAGHLHPLRQPDESLILQDGKGAHAMIAYTPPDEPNVGLGFHLCPDGNQLPHFNSTLASVQRLCKATASVHLTELETRQLLYQRLVPKISYALHGTAFSRSQCGKINSCIRQTILPRLRLNRHYPSPVLYGPAEYGGMEFPEVYTLQDTVQLEYLIKQLRWDKTVANDFLVALDSVQMCAGFTSPILEHTAIGVRYLEQSYIIELRTRLHEMQASLWIEKKWTPALQRVGDHSLMEQFAQLPGITRTALRQANAVRLYLRVVTIADLADVGGTFIPANMLDGGWRAGSDLKWPYQPIPPKHFWHTFRRCLRRSFCSNSPPFQRASHSMDLDTPLGAWLPVPRNTWFPAYRSSTTIYWRQHNDSHLYVMRPMGVPGFYSITGEVHTLPMESHPIRIQQMGDQLWTHKVLRLECRGEERTQAGRMIEDTISNKRPEVLTVGSDGSVRLQDGLAACAWILHANDDEQVKACYLLEQMTSLSSYRSELEGMYRGLRQVLLSGITPQIIEQWCDNEAAVTKSTRPLARLGDMITPDADIVLALHTTRHRLEGTSIHCRHVYGHQDTKTHVQKAGGEDTLGLELPELWQEGEDNNDTPRVAGHDARKELTLAAKVNIECDKIATETLSAALTSGDRPSDPMVLKLPYEGSRALLQIQGIWITSKHSQNIRKAKWGAAFLSYCTNRHGWTAEIFRTVNWQVVRTVRAQLTATQFMQTSKIMHGWLPVMHMQAHSTGLSQCPGCPCPDETMDHLYQCSNTAAKKTRDEALATVRRKGMSYGIPRAIMEVIITLLYDFTQSTNTVPPQHPRLAAAVKAQQRIGIHLFPRGFLATEWTELLDEFAVTHPERKISYLLKLLWMDFTYPLWQSRNTLAHTQRNLTQQAEEGSLAARLLWFLENSHVLAASDRFILDYTDEDIGRMTGFVRRQRVKQLETILKAYEMDKILHAKGQSVITKCFTRKSVPGSRIDTTVINAE